MARTRLRLSPAVERELVQVREAAEYAASHPVPGSRPITIRGYVRHDGRWYVEALEEENPEPLALDGRELIKLVRRAKDALDEAGKENTGTTDL